jgi:hypothetical protein
MPGKLEEEAKMNRQFDDEKASNMNEGAEGQPGGRDQMDKRKRVEQEVLKTLGYFDKDISLSDNPEFFAGVQKKIRSSQRAEKLPGWAVFQRKVLVPAILFTMIVINIVTAISVFRMAKFASLAKREGIVALAEYYGISRGDYSSYLK